MIEGEPPAVPEELVVCSLEAWDDVWRRNQFLVRELLAMDVGIRVLFVEPPHDVLHGALRGRLPRGLGLRPVVALAADLACGDIDVPALQRRLERQGAYLGTEPP